MARIWAVASSARRSGVSRPAESSRSAVRAVGSPRRSSASCSAVTMPSRMQMEPNRSAATLEAA